MSCSVNDLFMNAYVDNNFEDPHQVFANDLGIPRHEAKKIVYQILYSSQFLKSWAKNMCKGRRMTMEILEMIAEWRKGCDSACNLILDIERKLLEEKAQQDDVGTCEECGNSITRSEYATFKGKPYHICCLPVEVLL